MWYFHVGSSLWEEYELFWQVEPGWRAWLHRLRQLLRCLISRLVAVDLDGKYSGSYMWCRYSDFTGIWVLDTHTTGWKTSGSYLKIPTEDRKYAICLLLLQVVITLFIFWDQCLAPVWDATSGFQQSLNKSHVEEVKG